MRMSCSMQVRLGASAALVDQSTRGEAVKAEGSRRWMRLIACNQVSETPPRRRCCLETSVTPARIEIESLNWRHVDDRRAVHRHIDYTTPGSQYADAPDHWHQRHAALTDVLDCRQVAALGIAVVAVNVAAEDESTFVALANIEMACAEGNDVVDNRFHSLGYEGLQYVALDWKTQTCHRCEPRAVAGDDNCDLVGADRATRSFNTGHALLADHERGNFAAFHDVDATLVGATRVTPDDCIVPSRASAGLHQGAVNRKPRISKIKIGQQRSSLVSIEQLASCTVEA